MQSESYKLPHQYESWKNARSALEKILELTSLPDIIKQMRVINEEFNWFQDVFLCSKKQPSSIVELLKYAARAALQVQKLFPRNIAISHPIEQFEGKTHTIFTKRQALCLVSNMFFGTTHKQPQTKNLPPYFSFLRLSRRANQIVKTMLNYFERSQTQNKQLDKQHIVFIRIAEKPRFESWLECEDKLCEVRFHEKGSIEDLQSSIQIDFANKSIGGFFLSETYTQEDIIFINSPELMPAVLFHKFMQGNQCILMVGAQRYSKYSGYLDTYEFAGNFQDQRKVIQFKVSENKTVLVKDAWISAIDAIPYFISSQFNNTNLNRELNKAYVGFNIMGLDGGQKPISTGNWGSGAFNGNLEYKFIIQWLAASRAHRSIDYFSFANQKADQIPEIVKKYSTFTVKQLMKIVVKNSQKFESLRKVFKVLLSNSNPQKDSQIKQEQLEI